MGDRYVTITRPNDGDFNGSPRGYRSGPPEPSRTVYVGQLRYDTDEKTVRRWFEAYGLVQSVKLIYDKETGRSKGFGFVTFEDDRDARDALNDAGGRDLDGAAIKVNIAHGPSAMANGFGGGRGRGRMGNAGGGRGDFYGGGGGGSGRGAPYRPPYGRGFDRRPSGGTAGPAAGGAGGEGDRYSPGRYSPRGRSRSRSPGRKHERDERYDDAEEQPKRRRQNSPSKSRSPSRGRSASRSPQRSASRSPGARSASRSRSRSGTRSPSRQRYSASPPPASDKLTEQPGTAVAHAAAPAAPSPSDQPNLSLPAIVTAAAAVAEHTPPVSAHPVRLAPAAGGGGGGSGAKPPPNLEAVKKELLRLRRQEQELGGKVRSLQDELTKKERQVAQRDHELGEAQAQLRAVQPQLETYKQWVADLLEGATKLASSRSAATAAKAEARRHEESLAALQRNIVGEAERSGLDLPGGVLHYVEDEDAAWEQLAATIQESERVAAAEAAGGGSAARVRNGAAAAGQRGQQLEEGQQQSPEMQLQAAMQEAAMEGIDDA